MLEYDSVASPKSVEISIHSQIHQKKSIDSVDLATLFNVFSNGRRISQSE